MMLQIWLDCLKYVKLPLLQDILERAEEILYSKNV